jgi:hypothetical protein
MKVTEEIATMNYARLLLLWEESDKLLKVYKEGHHLIPISEGGKLDQVLIYLTLLHHFAIHVKRSLEFSDDPRIHNANIYACKKMLEDTSNKERQAELDKLRSDEDFKKLIAYVEKEYNELSTQDSKIEEAKVKAPRTACEDFLQKEGIQLYPRIFLPGEKSKAQIIKNINDKHQDEIPVEISDDDPTNKDGLIHICMKAGIPHLYYCNDRIGILKVKATNELLDLALTHEKRFSKATTTRGGTIASFSYVPIKEVIAKGLGERIAKSNKGVIEKV